MLVLGAVLGTTTLAHAEPELLTAERPAPARPLPAAGTVLRSERTRAVVTARIRFTDLARRTRATPSTAHAAEPFFERNPEMAPAEPDVSAPPISLPAPVVINAASPPPTNQL